MPQIWRQPRTFEAAPARSQNFFCSWSCVSSGFIYQRLNAFETRTYTRAGTAAVTVQCRNRHGKLHIRNAGHRLHLHAFGSLFRLLRGQGKRTNNRMRAYIRAVVALNAVFWNPVGRVNGNAAFFKRCGTLRERAVRRMCEHGQPEARRLVVNSPVREPL